MSIVFVGRQLFASIGCSAQAMLKQYTCIHYAPRLPQVQLLMRAHQLGPNELSPIPPPFLESDAGSPGAVVEEPLGLLRAQPAPSIVTAGFASSPTFSTARSGVPVSSQQDPAPHSPEPTSLQHQQQEQLQQPVQPATVNSRRVSWSHRGATWGGDGTVVVRRMSDAGTVASMAAVGIGLGCSSTLQDDVLDLSQRMVKGFVTRITRAPLYIAFKLWSGQARWGRTWSALCCCTKQAPLNELNSSA